MPHAHALLSAEISELADVIRATMSESMGVQYRRGAYFGRTRSSIGACDGGYETTTCALAPMQHTATRFPR